MRVFIRKTLFLLYCSGKKGAVGIGVGIERPMGKCFLYWLPLAKIFTCGITKDNGNKPLPYIIHRLLGGMEHVGSIKAIVAQFVVYDLEGRKIIHSPSLAEVAIPQETIHGKKQCRLGELTGMIAILGIAYGRHGKDYLGEGIATAQDIYSLEQTVATLTDSQLLLLKLSTISPVAFSR